MNIINFFNHPFFNIVGGISTLLIICSFIYTLYLIIAGILPVWYRLGIGLSKGKIAVFATNEFDSLKNMLIDSKLFKDKNIFKITSNELSKAAKSNIYLVHWKDFSNVIDDILKYKKDNIALLVYAPQSEGRIDEVTLNKINSHRNSLVVNFRGRLLNDILTSLITVSYERG